MECREVLGRERKVREICRYLQSLGIVADEARFYTAEEWKIVAREAKVNPPSSRSVASILERLDTGRDLNIVDQLKVQR